MCPARYELEKLLSNNESMEMYLETIYLLEKSQGHAHGVEIAKNLGISKASVTKATKILKSDGYIRKESYGSITLTEEGRILSEKIYHTHQLISLFLKHSLGVSNKEASENACKMEHVLTDSMIDSIKMYLMKNKIETTL